MGHAIRVVRGTMSTFLVDRRSFLAIAGAGLGTVLHRARLPEGADLRVAVLAPPPGGRTAADIEALNGITLGVEEVERTSSLFGASVTIAISIVDVQDAEDAAHAAFDAGAAAIIPLGNRGVRSAALRVASARQRVLMDVIGDSRPSALAGAATGDADTRHTGATGDRAHLDTGGAEEAGDPCDPWTFHVAPHATELAAAALHAAHAAQSSAGDMVRARAIPWAIVAPDAAVADSIRALDARIASSAGVTPLLGGAELRLPGAVENVGGVHLAVAVVGDDAATLSKLLPAAAPGEVIDLLSTLDHAPHAQSLAAVSWLPGLVRFGAAQLNDRHRARFGGDGMRSAGWLGWFAVKALGESALRARSAEPRLLRQRLLAARFDGHKGTPLSFSPAQRLMHPLYVRGIAGPHPHQAPLGLPAATEGLRTRKASTRGCVARRAAAGALLAACTLLGSPHSSAAQGAAARTPATIVPSAPASELLWISNEESRDVSIVRARDLREVGRIPVGERPRGIQASADGRRLYVALSDDHPNVESGRDAVAVIDTRTRRIVGRHSVGTDPEQFGLSPDGRRLYAANEDAGTASVTDMRTGRVVAALVVGIEPEGVAVSPDGRWVYITAETSNSVSVLDTRSNSIVANMLVDVRPRGVAFAPDGRRAYVTAEIGGTLSAIDVARHEVIGTVNLEDGNSKPVGVVVSRDGRTIYVTNGAAHAVSVIDAASLRVTGRIAVGRRPWGLALSPDGGRIYVANGLSNDVSIIDTRTRRVLGRVAAGTRPWGVAVTP